MTHCWVSLKDLAYAKDCSGNAGSLARVAAHYIDIVPGTATASQKFVT